MGYELTQNSILRISDAKCYQLIELYEAEPCLWKTTDPAYRVRGKRAAAAERIARKLRIKNFEARHVMIKFKNLRNSYCQELKKIGRSRDLGGGENGVYQPTVFWFKKMDSFLRPHLQQPTRSAIHSYPSPDERKMIHDEEKKVEKILIPEYVSEEDAPAESDVGEEESGAGEDECVPMPYLEEKIPLQEMDISHRQQQRIRKPIRHMKLGKYRSRAQHCCFENGRSSQMLQAIALCSEQLTKTRGDEFDSFGQYVASLLRAMPPPAARALQPRLVQLLTSAGDCAARATQTDDDVHIQILKTEIFLPSQATSVEN